MALRERFDQRFDTVAQSDLPADLDRFQQQAYDILHSDRVRRALDVEQESEATRSHYGETRFSWNALAARRLIEAGVRFVTVGLGGWDTHAGNFQSLRNRLLPELDRTLAALIDDLNTRGLLDTTIVYCAGEFGRTPHVNPAAGRDHWARSMSVLLAGSGFRLGYAHGTTDREGKAPATDACTPADLSATIFESLGIGPHQHVVTAAGREVKLFQQGASIRALLG